MRRVVELILLIVAGFGGFRAWETGRERARLEVIHDRMTREVGELPVGDPSKILIRARETGRPLEYAWLVHLPPNCPTTLQHSSGGMGLGMTSPKGEDFSARFQIREEGEGRPHACLFFRGGNMKFSLGDRRLGEFLKAHGGEILVERPGVAGTAVFAPGEPVVILRLTVPEALREQVTKAYTGYFEGGNPLVLFELTLNPKPRKP